jgi:DNA-binding response OmpR family regulator
MAAGFGWNLGSLTFQNEHFAHFLLADRQCERILDAMRGIPENSGIILAAEDEESDAALLKLAFGRAGSPKKLVIVRDGQEAVDYLSGEGPYGDRSSYPLPSLLLLDLKMPRMTGFDVLGWLRESVQFKNLPVIVLSSSTHESDIVRARQMGAWDYHVKPHGMAELVELVKQLTGTPLSPAPAHKGVYQECH